MSKLELQFGSSIPGQLFLIPQSTKSKEVLLWRHFDLQNSLSTDPSYKIKKSSNSDSNVLVQVLLSEE